MTVANKRQSLTYCGLVRHSMVYSCVPLDNDDSQLGCLASVTHQGVRLVSQIPRRRRHTLATSERFQMTCSVPIHPHWQRQRFMYPGQAEVGRAHVREHGGEGGSVLGSSQQEIERCRQTSVRFSTPDYAPSSCLCFCALVLVVKLMRIQQISREALIHDILSRSSAVPDSPRFHPEIWTATRFSFKPQETKYALCPHLRREDRKERKVTEQGPAK
ncbi:hypothetical protein V8C44DRAFT_345556 [Trichoderma aethiopicum]